MNVLLISAVCLLPDAPPVMPPDAPPVEHVSYVAASASCPCGIDGCVCPPGECDCLPSLVIQVTADCPPGASAEKSIVSALALKGWRLGEHYTVRRSSEGPCPQFFWKGKSFSEDGWPGWDEWAVRLKTVMGVAPPAASLATDDRKPLPPRPTAYSLKRGDQNDRSIIDNGEALPQPGDQTIGQPEGESFNASLPTGTPTGVAPIARAASVGFQTVLRSDYHTHVCNRCGHSWSHHDSNHGSYSAHRCPRCSNLDWDVSSGSAMVRVPVNGGYVASQPVRQYASRAVYRSCPNCPR